MNCIKNIGYYGLIDIEMMMGKDGEIYLNEINWRNSGGGFRSMHEGFDYCWWFYKNLKEESFHVDWEKPVNIRSFFMAEFSDFNNVVREAISIKKWNKQRKAVENFAIYNNGDMLHIFPTYCIQVLKNAVKYLLFRFNS